MMFHLMKPGQYFLMSGLDKLMIQNIQMRKIDSSCWD